MPIDRTRLPTWSEFLRAATERGVRVDENDLGIEGPRDKEPPVRYLQRADGLKVIVPPLALGEIVRETLLSSLCRLLDIDPARWGIEFEELPPDSLS